MNIKHIGVIIPAKNEEQLLPRCLYSIFRAGELIPKSVKMDVILCVDSSNDNTLKIGQSIIRSQGTVLEINKTNVGFARKYATEEALRRYQGPLESFWLANTDADCEVPLDWLNNHLLWARQNIQALAGIVKVDSYAEHDNKVPLLFEKGYTIHNDGSHPHVHGANLGVRADVYKKIGGWNPLHTAEDHDLWNRLIALNLNVKSHAACFVMTSGRKQGRAPKGFADTLAALNELNNVSSR